MDLDSLAGKSASIVRSRGERRFNSDQGPYLTPAREFPRLIHSPLLAAQPENKKTPAREFFFYQSF
jgi:hypothetical protein